MKVCGPLCQQFFHSFCQIEIAIEIAKPVSQQRPHPTVFSSIFIVNNEQHIFVVVGIEKNRFMSN
jgi:hypothetical protein